MKFKVHQYPTKWRWRFALFPTWFGKDDRLWLEFYQTRYLGGLSWERRDTNNNVIELSLYP